MLAMLGDVGRKASQRLPSRPHHANRARHFLHVRDALARQAIDARRVVEGPEVGA